jgi:hypothetical protein
LAESKEVHAGTETTISCVITGITKPLDSVIWKKDGIDVTDFPEGHHIVYNGRQAFSNSQTTTLSVKAEAVNADSKYTCEIKSNEWLVTSLQTTLVLNVFGNHSDAFNNY